MPKKNLSSDEFIYRIEGESLAANPSSMFNSHEVYLIVDDPLKKIWIWAGKKSRLFQRYVATNLAGKLKGKNKKNYKYETIKQGQETEEFVEAIEKFKNYNPEARSYIESLIKEIEKQVFITAEGKMPDSVTYFPDVGVETSTETERQRVMDYLKEIRTIQFDVKSSMEHLDQILISINRILAKEDE